MLTMSSCHTENNGISKRDIDQYPLSDIPFEVSWHPLPDVSRIEICHLEISVEGEQLTDQIYPDVLGVPTCPKKFTSPPMIPFCL